MKKEVKVSEIQIIPIKPTEGLIGFASFVLDEKFYIGSVAVYTRLGDFGYRLVYPTKKVGDKNINIFYPINSTVGRKIEEIISEKVNEIFYEHTTKKT
jgi:stage V sporulation protein G